MKKIIVLSFVLVLFQSCVSKKKFTMISDELELTTNDLRGTQSNLEECRREKKEVFIKFENVKETRSEREANLLAQIEDLKEQRKQSFTQVGDLTVLSKSANDNVAQTIRQLEQKDQYIKHLMYVRSKADSINLALSVNLKSVLKKGIDDEDVDVMVDKTVVFINLSDKMMFQSGMYQLTPRAGEVLNKIAQIIKAHPELDVMVEGYTDNVPIKNSCFEDNWDLSVRRATQVVKTLQKNHGVDPNKLIAAGRGEYNKLTNNSNAYEQSANRRTRIILLPKLNQFYDLLKPQNIAINK